MNKIKTFSLKSILTTNGEVLSYGPAYTTGHLRAARRLSRFCFELYCGCTGEETGSKFVPQTSPTMQLETTPIQLQAQPEVGQLNLFQNHWQTNHTLLTNWHKSEVYNQMCLPLSTTVHPLTNLLTVNTVGKNVGFSLFTRVQKKRTHCLSFQTWTDASGHAKK